MEVMPKEAGKEEEMVMAMPGRMAEGEEETAMMVMPAGTKEERELTSGIMPVDGRKGRDGSDDDANGEETREGMGGNGCQKRRGKRKKQ